MKNRVLAIARSNPPTATLPHVTLHTFGSAAVGQHVGVAFQARTGTGSR